MTLAKSRSVRDNSYSPSSQRTSNLADQATQGLLSPWLRACRMKAVVPFLRGTVLDYGCGSGALASMVASSSYVGYDVDAGSVAVAQAAYPEHTFTNVQPDHSGFDTVASLAVIEHMRDPARFMATLASFCRPNGTIVITTPNPALDPVHHLGARVGLFSHDASEEHVSLLDRKTLLRLSETLGLRVIRYKRFLMGANQLLVMQR